VDDAPRMCEGHRLADLFEGAEILAKLLARFASLSEGLGQSSAANDLHRKERSPVGVAQLIDRHDAGMLQLSADLSLFDEALPQVRVVLVFLVQELDCYVAAKLLIVPAVHDPNSATPKLPLDGVFARAAGFVRAEWPDHRRLIDVCWLGQAQLGAMATQAADVVDHAELWGLCESAPRLSLFRVAHGSILRAARAPMWAARLLGSSALRWLERTASASLMKKPPRRGR
jgi:hypothetical protein